MSDEIFEVATHCVDVAALGQDYSDRVDGERILLGLPREIEVGDEVRFVVLLVDGTPAFAGAGRCIQVSDQGPEAAAFRFETLLDSLAFDDRSAPVYEYIVAVRQLAYQQAGEYEAEQAPEDAGEAVAHADADIDFSGAVTRASPVDEAVLAAAGAVAEYAVDVAPEQAEIEVSAQYVAQDVSQGFEAEQDVQDTHEPDPGSEYASSSSGPEEQPLDAEASVSATRTSAPAAPVVIEEPAPDGQADFQDDQDQEASYREAQADYQEVGYQDAGYQDAGYQEAQADSQDAGYQDAGYQEAQADSQEAGYQDQAERVPGQYAEAEERGGTHNVDVTVRPGGQAADDGASSSVAEPVLELPSQPQAAQPAQVYTTVAPEPLSTGILTRPAIAAHWAPAAPRPPHRSLRPTGFQERPRPLAIPDAPPRPALDRSQWVERAPAPA